MVERVDDRRGARRLAAAGVAAILATAAAPHALDAWRDRRLHQEQVRQQRIVEVKQREIACLERLGARLRPGMDVEAEIAACRRRAAAGAD